MHTPPPRPNRSYGMTRPPTPAIGFKVEAAMASAEINAELVWPLGTPSFPPGTHDYDPKKHDLIEGVSKCVISREEAQAKFNELHEARESHDEVYTDSSKMNERVGAAAVINRYFQDGETTCRQLSNTIFAAEATAITLALSYYRHMGPVHHDVVYSDSMSCLQAIEGKDTDNPFICHIMNLLWLLSDKGTHPFLLDTKPLWHWGKWKSGPTCKRDPWSRHRPFGKCPIYRFEATGQLLHSSVGSKQVGCSCTWQKSFISWNQHWDPQRNSSI